MAGTLAIAPLGLLIGLSLGALGAGGSILAVPALVYVAGQSPAAATTSSLLVVGFSALVGALRHQRAGRVRVRDGVVFGCAGVGGSLLGTVLNARLDPNVLLLAFAGLIVFAAHRMLTGCPTCTQVGEARATAAGGTLGSARLHLDAGTIAKVLLTGTGVGFFTGLFGVGGGFVIIPALTLALKFAMPQAIGTSLLVIVINAAVALAARYPMPNVDWAVTLSFAGAAGAGVLAGGHLADRLPAKTMLRGFAALLVAVAFYTAARSVGALVAR